MNKWRLLITPPARGAWNMALDETLLEAVSRKESMPTLRLYAWEPACLSLGYAQPLSDVDLTRLRERGWDLVRRATGGRAVLHADELTYSVIAPLDEPSVAGTVLQSYRRLAGALVMALELLKVHVNVIEATSGPHHSISNPVCFEVPSSYEITVDGKKLVGSAQARRKEGVLQHGSLPLTGDLTRILQVLIFPDEKARSLAAEKLLSRATTVETALHQEISWDDAAQAYISAFQSVLDLELHPVDLSTAERKRTDELVRNKYAHPS